MRKRDDPRAPEAPDLEAKLRHAREQASSLYGTDLGAYWQGRRDTLEEWLRASIAAGSAAGRAQSSSSGSPSHD